MKSLPSTPSKPKRLLARVKSFLTSRLTHVFGVIIGGQALVLGVIAWLSVVETEQGTGALAFSGAIALTLVMVLVGAALRAYAHDGIAPRTDYAGKLLATAAASGALIASTQFLAVAPYIAGWVLTGSIAASIVTLVIIRLRRVVLRRMASTRHEVHRTTTTPPTP